MKIGVSLFPVLSLMAYLFLWFAPPVNLQDPWDEAFSLFTSGNTIRDISARKRRIDSAGIQLKELVRIHPYHARVHYLLGQYYKGVGDYDFSISEAKEAIRLGSGATARRVDGDAKRLLVAAVVDKAQPAIALNDYRAASAILSEAYDIHPTDKTHPATLAKMFEEVLSSDPRRGEFLYVLGSIAVSQEQIPLAIAYLEESVAINPGLTAAQDLLSTLMHSSSSPILRHR